MLTLRPTGNNTTAKRSSDIRVDIVATAVVGAYEPENTKDRVLVQVFFLEVELSLQKALIEKGNIQCQGCRTIAPQDCNHCFLQFPQKENV